MTNLLAPIALVSYAVAAIFGFSAAILISTIFRLLDILLLRFALRMRAKRRRHRTEVRVGSVSKIY
jgi:uncharacterized membrane protein